MWRIGLGVTVVVGWLTLVTHAEGIVEKEPAAALAKRIDQHLADGWKGKGIVPARRADDAEFLRRVTLDLTGRIPLSHEVYAFLESTASDKRARLIDRLLDSPAHSAHMSRVWRAMFLPEAQTGEARFFQPGLEAWLLERFRRNVPYDQLVRDLLTQPLPEANQQPRAVLTSPNDANALGFFAAKDAKPESLAAATTRLFLGVQLDCAQCHDHPFASWTREQFWEQAAFFAGVERQGKGAFAPLREMLARRTVTITPEEKTSVTPRYLNGNEPKLTAGESPRVTLAKWITSTENAYFANATVNRVWHHFFGIGLVDPVDDFHDKNLASHPKLLDDVAHRFVSSGYNLRHLMRAICLTDAYQRTSAQSHPSQADARQFARMSVRGLSAEQFFDSLVRATGYREPASQKNAFDADRNAPRSRFLTQFATAARPVSAETSVSQALSLMNGSFVADATSLVRTGTLTAVLDVPSLSAEKRIESLYVAVLSRLPTAEETARLMTYLKQADAENERARLGDVYWALLNSAEFRVNH